jgi:phosphatidylglycerophosphatase A
LFRFFDILKPYPIYIVDKNMKNGFGVVLDDVIAGIYSSIILLIIVSFTYYA